MGHQLAAHARTSSVPSGLGVTDSNGWRCRSLTRSANVSSLPLEPSPLVAAGSSDGSCAADDGPPCCEQPLLLPASPLHSCNVGMPPAPPLPPPSLLLRMFCSRAAAAAVAATATAAAVAPPSAVPPPNPLPPLLEGLAMTCAASCCQSVCGVGGKWVWSQPSAS
jgi:hypothetical protein